MPSSTATMLLQQNALRAEALIKAINHSKAMLEKKDAPHFGFFAFIAEKATWLKVLLGLSFSLPFVICGAIFLSPILIVSGIFIAAIYGLQIITEEARINKNKDGVLALDKVCQQNDLFQENQKATLELLNIFENDIDLFSKKNQDLSKNIDLLSAKVSEYQKLNQAQATQIKNMDDKLSEMKLTIDDLKIEREALSEGVRALELAISSFSKKFIKEDESREAFSNKLQEFIENKESQMSSFLLSIDETLEKLRALEKANQQLVIRYERVLEEMEKKFPGSAVNQGVSNKVKRSLF